SGERAGGDGDRSGGEGIDALDDQRRRDRGAQREAAIDRQVGEVEDAEGQEHAEGDETEHEPDLDGPQEGDDIHEEVMAGRAAASSPAPSSPARSSPARSSPALSSSTSRLPSPWRSRHRGW